MGEQLLDSQRTARRGTEALRVVLGLVLLVAAGLKGHELALDPLTEDSFLASPPLQIAAIEVEILLGLWLLSGLARRAAWVAALGFFGVMAGVSLYMALAGQTSCGCFGRLTVNPWLTFAFDGAAVAALAVWRPVRAEGTGSVGWLRGVLRTGLGTAAFLTLIGGALLLAFDDPAAALAQLRGEVIAVEPSVSQVGDGIALEQRRFTVQLTNHGERPVRLLGGTTTCSCIATEDLPTTVPAGESRSIAVDVKFSGGAGRFQHSFILYTDDAKQPVVTARFAGRVIEPPSP